MVNGGGVLISNLTNVEEHKNKVLINAKDETGRLYFNISFRYYEQRDFFGIGEQDSTWFSNLFDRLKDFSRKTNHILENYQERRAYRLHPINFDAKNSPISIETLETIHKDAQKLIENDLVWQFQISKGTGRVIGFFNEDRTVFYIVLLDPKHNAQPSADYGYSVDDTEIALTDYEKLKFKIAEIEEKMNRCSKHETCPISNIITQEHLSSNLCYIAIDFDLKETYKHIIENGNFQPLIEQLVLEKLGK